MDAIDVDYGFIDPNKAELYNKSSAIFVLNWGKLHRTCLMTRASLRLELIVTSIRLPGGFEKCWAEVLLEKHDEPLLYSDDSDD